MIAVEKGNSNGPPSIHPSLSQCEYSVVVFWTKRHLVKSLQTNENDSPARSHSAPAALLALPLPTDIMLCCQLPVWLSDSFSLSPCFFPTAPHDTHDTRTKSVGRLATHEHGRKVACAVARLSMSVDGRRRSYNLKREHTKSARHDAHNLAPMPPASPVNPTRA